jgi:uncharacterized membrane protein
MLWMMLTIICFVMPIAGALGAAARSGVGGHIIASVVGTALGAIFAWSMSAAAGLAEVRLQGYPENVRERYFRLLYLGALSFSFIALFAGSSVTSMSLRLLAVGR